jgi:hypothetical protein
VNARHYHVIENVPGYMPMSDPDTCTTKREAEQCAKYRADRYRNDWDGNYRITGNQHDGYTISDLDRTHDLGVVINIAECAEIACLEELEQ